MVPVVGSIRSAMRRISVVLPQPDGPISETKSPWRTSRSASWSATCSPFPTVKTLLTPRTEMTTGRPSSPPLALASATERLAPEELAPAGVAHELAVPHGHLAPHRHHARPAVDLHALEGAVVDVHLVRPGADRAPVRRVVHHDVGVGADGDRALARVEAEELGGVRRGDLYEALERQLAAADAVGVEQVHAVLDRGDAVRDLRERVAAHGLLLDVERRVVGADGVDEAPREGAPQRLLVALRAQRRAHHVLGALEVRPLGVALVEHEVRGHDLHAEVDAAHLRLDGGAQRPLAGEVHDVALRARHL